MEKKKRGGYWMPYIRPYLSWFIIGPLCMIVEVIGEVVMPKIAGMESSAKSRSVDPSATKTRRIGVKCRLPFTVVRSLPPSYSSVTASRVFTV